jgi:hypothetical protein
MSVLIFGQATNLLCFAKVAGPAKVVPWITLRLTFHGKNLSSLLDSL